MISPSATRTRRRRAAQAALLSLLAWPAWAANLVVTNTADSGPGSLRQALLDANATPELDGIGFAVPGAGPHVIRPTTPLPEVSAPVGISGYTQSGSAVNTSAEAHNAVIKVVLDGIATPPGASGLRFTNHSGSFVTGLSIVDFTVGIVLSGGGAHKVSGCFLGVRPDGTSGPNSTGVLVSGSTSNTVGGLAAGNRNLISANFQTGVELRDGADRTIVRGNLIGPDRSGLASQGFQWHGVYIANASDTEIGSGSPLNAIAFNRASGVVIHSGRRNRIVDNLIHSNPRAIELMPAGVTPNDPGDADEGPNDQQNHPAIVSAGLAGGLIPAAILELDSRPQTQYTIDVYTSDVCDSGGSGDAQHHVSSLGVTTDASGHARVAATLWGEAGPGRFVSASATDPEGNTSELSACARIAAQGLFKGDFDRDTGTDLVLRETATGAHHVWRLRDTTRVGELSFTPAWPGPEWRLAAVGDFDAVFGNDLLLWNEQTGQVVFWRLSGVAGNERQGEPVPLADAPVLPTNWRPVAAADFNGDFKPDLVWRNVDSQKLVVWTLVEMRRTGTLVPNPAQAVNANWTLAAAADVNGDGWNDFVWHNADSGNVVLWLLDGNLQRLAGQFTNPASAGSPNWKVVAVGDYGSGPGGVLGSADLVWRNDSSGRLVVWHLDQQGNRTAGMFVTPAAPEGDPLAYTVAGPR